MKAESISSKACVELPSTSASMRIQAISYMNEDGARERRDHEQEHARGAHSPG